MKLSLFFSMILASALSSFLLFGCDSGTSPEPPAKQPPPVPELPSPVSGLLTYLEGDGTWAVLTVLEVVHRGKVISPAFNFVIPLDYRRDNFVEATFECFWLVNPQKLQNKPEAAIAYPPGFSQDGVNMISWSSDYSTQLYLVDQFMTEPAEGPVKRTRFKIGISASYRSIEGVEIPYIIFPVRAPGLGIEFVMRPAFQINWRIATRS